MLPRDKVMMGVLNLLFLAVGLLAFVALAPTRVNAKDKPCHNNPIDFPHNRGCSRFVRGYDITGAATKRTIMEANTLCECIHACARNTTLCVSYVWKYVIPPGCPDCTYPTKRSCVLYSNFVLPYDVQFALSWREDGGSEDSNEDPHSDDDSWWDTHSSFNVDPFDSSYPTGENAASHTQEGQLVPACTKSDGTGHDADCVSGPVWALDNGRLLC